MRTLFLGRHGETKLNAEERLRSWIDEPLNAKGIQEAEAMGQAMAGTPIDRVYCSSLDRADHTAQIVAKRHGLKPIPREWFKPLNYGDLNGELLSTVKPELLKLNDLWETDPGHKAPNGESFTEFQDRNLSGLHAIFKSAKDGQAVMLVAHLRNCLLIHGIAMAGGPLKGKDVHKMGGLDWHQASGAVSQFQWDGQQFSYIGMFFEPEDAKEEKAGVS